MKLFQVRQRTREGDHILCAPDVDAARNILRNSEIVNCGKMKYASCLLLDQFQIRLTQSEPRLGDVAFDDLKPRNTASSKQRNAFNLFVRVRRQPRLYEQNEIALVRREAF